jgi:pilus assembly protein CpaE
MSDVVRLAIVDPSDASRNSLKSLLLGIETVWLEAECSRYDFFCEVVEQTQPDIALISLDANPQQGLDLVATVSHKHPGCNTLVVSSSQEGSLILRAMRNGAKEFLSSPLQIDDFLAALERLQFATRTGTKGKRPCRVMTVCGASGGVGCTSLATNLGCIFAKNPDNAVAIIDLDLTLGDADVWLDIIPDYTILDISENISRLDFSLLKRSLTKHETGAYLLPRPLHLDDKSVVTPEQLHRIITLLRTNFTHVMIDVSKAYSTLDLEAISLSDDVILVTQLDLATLRNVVRVIQFLEEREHGDKVRIVVNRVGLEDSQISLNKALQTIGKEVYWQIPNEYAIMVESRNNGIPLIVESPRAKLTRSIVQLAEKLDNPAVEVSEENAPADKPKRRLFSFLGK